MGFQEALRTCFSKYAKADGRASRSEFWYFHLAIFLYMFVAGFGRSLCWYHVCLLVFGGWRAGAESTPSLLTSNLQPQTWNLVDLVDSNLEPRDLVNLVNLNT